MNINTSYTSAFSSNQNQQNLQSKKNAEDKDQTAIQSKKGNIILDNLFIVFTLKVLQQ